MRNGVGVATATWEDLSATERSRLGKGWEGAVLLLLTLVLLSFGLVMLYSASAAKAQMSGLEDYHYVVRQVAGGAVGLVGLAVLARIDYRHLRRLAWPLLGVVTLLLLVIVLPGTQPIAPEINGARRWLVVGGVTLQPSEFAKLVIVIWTAALAVKKQEKLPSLSRGLFPFLIIWSVVVGLIALEPSLSAAAIVLLLASLVVFAGGARIGHFLVLG
ncbi:MAG: FtsW/RodA/SpoVE family cell cycle protein, partial [Gemmatimonadota bacterium]